jgi:multicomponent Na+:H+ antiporter subunit B
MIVYSAEVLTVLLAISALALIRARDLFSVVVLLAVYSGLLAAAFAVMGAVDVAFMEAVVGTSVSTVFLMGLMWWIEPTELSRYPRLRRFIVAVPVLALGALLVWGVNALPPFGEPTAPGMVHVSPYYIDQSVAEMKTPNVVTAVLADYRSFDTMIEAAVVVAAVLACLLVLKHRDDPII